MQRGVFWFLLSTVLSGCVCLLVFLLYYMSICLLRSIDRAIELGGVHWEFMVWGLNFFGGLYLPTQLSLSFLFLHSILYTSSSYWIIVSMKRLNLVIEWQLVRNFILLYSYEISIAHILSLFFIFRCLTYYSTNSEVSFI